MERNIVISAIQTSLTSAKADYTKQSEGSIQQFKNVLYQVLQTFFFCLDMAIIKQGLVIAKVDYSTKLSGNIILRSTFQVLKSILAD